MIIFNALSLLIHLAVGVSLLRKRVEYSILFGYLFFLQTWSVVSCFYNDLGIYNLELFGYTETTLATARLALFYVVFNLGFYLVTAYLAKRPLVRRDYSTGLRDLRLGNLKLTAYFFGLLLLGYIVYSLTTGGIPIFEGIQKVMFFKEAGPVERFLLGYGPFLAFTLGYFRRLRGRFSANGVLLTLMLVYLVLTGNKFSALMRLVVAYYAAVFVQHWLLNRSMKIFRRRYVVTGLVILAVLLVGAFASYSFLGLNAQEAGQLLLDRVLALQGHLWWASDHNLFALDRFDSNHWQAEWTAVVQRGEVAEGSVGMKYVMVQAIGADKAFPIFDTGYLYTMAYPAILTLTFSYPAALLFQLLAGALMALLLYYLHYCLMYRHFVRALVAMTVILPFMGVLSTGDLYVFLTPGMACKLLLLAVLELGVLRYAPHPASREKAGEASGVTG